MNTRSFLKLVPAILAGIWLSGTLSAQQFHKIGLDEYRDKMMAGWIGQMAGVGQGGPTEFRWQEAIIPANEVPTWKPEMINQFHQDDIYVEMTFLRTLELYGLDVSIRQAGIDFANSEYPLWHANLHGRENLRSGIAPPDSGHPEFNSHADDIDYQIEADFSGLVAPGMPNIAIELGETFGRLMNYGDGLYGGQFVGGMYAAAFFEDDIEKIVRAGLACIPQQSQYAECIRDVLQWYHQAPDDWQATWNKIEAKYQKNPDYRRFSCDKGKFNIDAKINGAYIVMGLLYGKGDLDQTIVISTRCGQDSDCNPSNAAGVLFTTIGYQDLPDHYKSALNPEGKFSHTPYNFPTLVEVCEKLARQAVVRAGGRIETQADGKEVMLIPQQTPEPTAFEQCWEPGPAANSRFTEEEMAQITTWSKARKMEEFLKHQAPGWTLSQCGPDMDAPAILDEWNGREEVLLIHPQDRQTPCILTSRIEIPQNQPLTLHLAVSHHPSGDYDLILRADDELLLRQTVGATTAKDGWLDIQQDLSAYAGREIQFQIVNQPTGWAYEAAYIGQIELR